MVQAAIMLAGYRSREYAPPSEDTAPPHGRLDGPTAARLQQGWKHNRTQGKAGGVALAAVAWAKPW